MNNARGAYVNVGESTDVLAALEDARVVRTAPHPRFFTFHPTAVKQLRLWRLDGDVATVEWAGYWQADDASAHRYIDGLLEGMAIQLELTEAAVIDMGGGQ